MVSVVLYTLGVLFFAVGVALSIGLHELGHMVPAKKFGVKVTQFFVGFGKTVWSVQRGETEFGLKRFPLGGYVKLVGMLPPDPDPSGTASRAGVDAEHPGSGPIKVRKSNTGMFTQLISDARSAEYELVEPEDEKRLFYLLPWWKKVIVMSGGPLVNLAIAFVLFAGLFGIYGVNTLTTQISSVSACVIPQTESGPERECTPADPRSPAAAAGLLPGDTITSFNGTAIEDWEQLSVLIRANRDGDAEIGYVRDGAPQVAAVNTTVNDVRSLDGSDTFEQAGFLGVSPGVERERRGLLFTVQQMGESTKQTVIALANLPPKVYGVGKAALGLEERDPESPVSVVGAGRIAGEISSDTSNPAADRLALLVGLLAGLNLFLGMFNFIPLLPLDGGHIAGALYEAARRGVARLFGRPDPGYFDVAKLLPVAYAVGAALLLMGVVLILGDIFAPVRIT